MQSIEHKVTLGNSPKRVEASCCHLLSLVQRQGYNPQVRLQYRSLQATGHCMVQASGLVGLSVASYAPFAMMARPNKGTCVRLTLPPRPKMPSRLPLLSPSV